MVIADLTTSKVVKEYLSQKLIETPADGVIARLVSAASAEITHWCEQSLIAGAGNETYTVEEWMGDRKMLPFHPVREIISIVQDRGFGQSSVTIDPSRYRLRLRNGIAYVEALSFEQYGVYECILTVGYDRTDAREHAASEDLEQVACELVVTMCRESSVATLGEGRLGLASESDTNANTGFTKGKSYLKLRPDLQQRLRPYTILMES